jgi:deoxyadenosine/deoxycytidine kinase
MLISIVGNIGTGKTTLVNALSSIFLDIKFIEEIRSEFLDDIYNNQGFFFRIRFTTIYNA